MHTSRDKAIALLDEILAEPCRLNRIDILEASLSAEPTAPRGNCKTPHHFGEFASKDRKSLISGATCQRRNLPRMGRSTDAKRSGQTCGYASGFG